MIFLQKSLLFFLPAIFVCIRLQRILGVLILLLNFSISMIVHRENREEDFDLWDYIDKLCIFIWILYNTYLVILVSSYLNKKWDLTIFILLLLSLIGVILVYYFNIKRKEVGKWRSKEQDLVHGLMHISGGIGSLFLLLAINKIRKSSLDNLVSQIVSQ